MTAPPWGHKPPAVDRYAYWSSPPPVSSPRLSYWLRRLREGSWWPNRHLLCEGYDGRSELLGVYIWEYLHVLAPVLAACSRAGYVVGEERAEVVARLVRHGVLPPDDVL